MSQFGEFYDTYLVENNQQYDTDLNNSTNTPIVQSKQRNDNIIPSINIKQEDFDSVLSGSLDVKKQLSLSLNTAGVELVVAMEMEEYPNHNPEETLPISSLTKEVTMKMRTIRMIKMLATKRRDNINDKIQELLTLIPSEFSKATQIIILKRELK